MHLQIGHLWLNNTKHIVVTSEHLSFSLDLLLPDFFQFPQLKNVLKGYKFMSDKEVTAKATKN
jgi:hypothetical protein